MTVGMGRSLNCLVVYVRSRLVGGRINTEQHANSLIGVACTWQD